MRNHDIQLTMKEQNKIKILTLLMRQEIDVSMAISILKCSERTLYRWKARLSEHGPAGLVHGNRGKSSPFKLNEAAVLQILKLKDECYQNINDVHLREILIKQHGLRLGRETLRSLLRAYGVVPKNKRRPPKYRGRRERKPAFGMMIQIDASLHRWLGPMYPELSLHGGIDDATNRVWATFTDTECTYGYFDLMGSIIETAGLPLSLYSDRHTIFHPLDNPTILAQMKGHKERLTQFGRAMQELGIETIKAYTPQAKGRIERLWRTFQDRLAAELQLAGIVNKSQAQIFLKDFLKRFNEQFSIKPQQAKSCFRKAPPPHVMADILCLKEERVVNNDHTVSYNGRILQIPRPKGWRSYAKKRVEVWERQDGKIKIAMDDKILAVYEPLIEEIVHGLAA